MKPRKKRRSALPPELGEALRELHAACVNAFESTDGGVAPIALRQLERAEDLIDQLFPETAGTRQFR